MMAEKFNGFSQDEINKVSGAKTRKPNAPTADATTVKQAFRGQHVGIRRMPEKWSRSSEHARKQQSSTKTNGAEDEPTVRSTALDSMPEVAKEINLERSMSHSIEEALYYHPTKLQTSRCIEKPSDTVADDTVDCNKADESSILKLPTMDNNVSSTSSSTIDDSSLIATQRSAPKTAQITSATSSVVTLNLDSPFKGISLKDFESHRKLIEEQNKQKKELLYRAIEHHSQKTAAESRKIEEIKTELSKLNNDLAVDVAMLRKQIDTACIHYANIEKQYIKIEAQFLKSKIDLHNAAEKKELLTEHLCTVIAHNEDRKAQKLSELMEKVGLPPSGEYEGTSASKNVNK